MSIYPPARQPTHVLNGVGAMSDGSGTINPAALNASGTLSFIGVPNLTTWKAMRPLCRSRLDSPPRRAHRRLNPKIPSSCPLSRALTDLVYVTGGLIQSSTESGPRGVKRSRSPEQY